MAQLRQLRPYLAAALIVTFFGSQRYAGVVLIFAVLMVIPWVIYSLFIMIWRPSTRLLQSAKVAIWVIAILIMGSAQYYMSISAQSSADHVISAIQLHLKTTGNCPKNLETIGIDEAKLRQSLGMSGYLCESGRPSFMYHSTFIPFASWQYDFDSRVWEGTD